MIRKPVVVIDDFSGGQDTKSPILSMALNKSPNMRNFHSMGVRNRLVKRGGYAKLNSSAVESDYLDAFYPPGYQTTDYALRDAAARTEISQGFKPATTSTVTKVRLWLKKTGTPAGTDTVTLEIQTDSSGVPSGTPVSNGTSAAVDISDSLTTSYAWITFTFATNPTLTAATQYHLVLTGAFTVSDTNYVLWGVDNYDVIYQNGTMSVYDNSTWVADGNYDAIFEVYITGGAAGNDALALWDFSSKNMMMGVFGTFLYKMDKDTDGTPDETWDTIPGGSSWDSYTKLMLHGDGTDTSTTITDEIGHVMTAAGNAQIDTAQKKFGTGSILLDGNGDEVTTPDHADWALGTTWTIDCWIMIDDLPGAGLKMTVVSQYQDASNEWSIDIQESGGQYRIRFGLDSGSWNSSLQSWSADTWYHIAIVSDSGGVSFYRDGSLINKVLTPVDVDDITGNLVIGSWNSANDFDGWIEELRISKGIARWSANFTAPTAAYSASSLPLTSSRYWTFGDWQSGRALINTDIGLYTYTGTGNASAVSGAPVGKFFIVWKNYAMLFGIRGSPNTGRYSDLSDYTTWTASNTLNFDTNDGDVITGVRILKGKLFVFKRYSVHRVTYLGSSPTFQVDQILGIGCPSHYCIKEIDMGGEVGTVLVFPTTDKKLAVFDGYNVQVIADTVSEESNDLFASADDQPITFADMDYKYIDLFHAVVKQDTYEYILYCVLNGDTQVNYAFVLDYKIGAIFPYDGQPFASSLYMMSTNKSKILYCGGYTGYVWQQESGNSDDGTAITAYWVSGKIRSNSVALLNKNLLLGINLKYITSASTMNMSFQSRLNWAVSWTTAENFSFNHNDEYNFGRTVLFDIGTIANMFQIKIKDSSSNPAPTIYSVELYGEPLGVSMGSVATA